MIQAVIFDMDGVLFDTERVTCEVRRELCRELGCPDVTVYAGEYMGLSSGQHRAFFMDRFGPDFPYDEFERRSQEDSFKRFQKEGVPVKPGLYQLLAYLKENGFLVAAATSTQRSTVMKYFEETKITGYFQQIICGDMVKKSKPEPEIYLTAAAALGVAPEFCMAVEDSPNGLTSAYRAGMKTVMVPDQVPPTQELRKMLYACVPSLDGLIPLLEQAKQKKA